MLISMGQDVCLNERCFVDIFAYWYDYQVKWLNLEIMGKLMLRRQYSRGDYDQTRKGNWFDIFGFSLFSVGGILDLSNISKNSNIFQRI